jgi:hypothetical protein
MSEKLYRCNYAHKDCEGCPDAIPHKCSRPNITATCPWFAVEIKCRIVRARDAMGRLVKDKGD